MAEKQLGSLPTNKQDIATKDYVDNAVTTNATPLTLSILGQNSAAVRSTIGAVADDDWRLINSRSPIPGSVTAGSLESSFFESLDFSVRARNSTAVDAANINAALANQSDVIAGGGTFSIASTTVTVPENKRLVVEANSQLRWNDGALSTHTAGQIRNIVLLNSYSSFVGSIDGNRDGQDKNQWNNTNGDGQINGIVCYGTEQNPKTNVFIDATIKNVAVSPATFGYVKDSYVKIRAKDCGGLINFYKCENIVVDIEYENPYNKGWKAYQHCVDYNGCKNIVGRVIIRNMKGDVFRSGNNITFGSKWVSGLTITDSDNIVLNEAVCTAVPNFAAASLGFSFLGNRNMTVHRLQAIGCSEGGLELGSLVDSEINNFHIDGQYATNSDSGYVAPCFGINLYNLSNPADFLGRTIEYARNIRFNGGSVVSCRSSGLNLQAAQFSRWNGVSFIGNSIGALIETKVLWSEDYSSVSPATSPELKSHIFTNCDFNFNEGQGVWYTDGTDIQFHSCRFVNNGQQFTYGSNRLGNPIGTIGAGFYSRTDSVKSGLVISNCIADDNQANTTAPGFLSRNTPYRIAVDRVEKFGIGQTIVVQGVTGTGDLKTRIQSIELDELVLQDPVTVFPEVSLGTISSNGTTVTGTNFLTALTGRAYIKVGSEYRRVRKVRSNTEAVVEQAFSTNLSGVSATIERTTITASASQTHGYFFHAGVLSPVLLGPTPTGNTVLNIYNNTNASTPLNHLPYDRISSQAVVSVTGTLTLDRAPSCTYYVVISGANGAPILPIASGNRSVYRVRNNHTVSMSLRVTGSDTINGTAVPASGFPISAGSSITVIADPASTTNWITV